MNLLLSAIGATAAALLEVGLVPYLAIGDARLHPVLIGAVVWTIVGGLEGGIAWGFVGGLVLDILLARPLGASSVALLLAVGGAFVISSSLLRVRGLAPIVAVPVLSLAYSMILNALAVGGPQATSPGITAPILFPGVVYDTVLGVVVGPLAVSLHDRRIPEERVEW
jgi:rod shape-determining protein MreD